MGCTTDGECATDTPSLHLLHTTCAFVIRSGANLSSLAAACHRSILAMLTTTRLLVVLRVGGQACSGNIVLDNEVNQRLLPAHKVFMATH